MLAVPRLTAVTTPLLSTVAILGCALRKVTAVSVASAGSVAHRSWIFSPTRKLSSSFGVVNAIFFTSWLTITVALAVTSGLDVLEQVIVQVPAFIPVTLPPATVAILSSELVHVRVLILASAG